MNETLPRKTIAAKLKGPGPGRYKLPSTCGHQTHDFTQHMKPAYSFGQNLGHSYISKVSNKIKASTVRGLNGTKIVIQNYLYF